MLLWIGRYIHAWRRPYARLLAECSGLTLPVEPIGPPSSGAGWAEFAGLRIAKALTHIRPFRMSSIKNDVALTTACTPTPFAVILYLKYCGIYISCTSPHSTLRESRRSWDQECRIYKRTVGQADCCESNNRLFLQL